MQWNQLWKNIEFGENQLTFNNALLIMAEEIYMDYELYEYNLTFLF